MAEGMEGMKVGRVFGVPLAVHWSVAVVFVLLAFALAEGVLPSSAEGYATSTYWIAGAAGGLLFLLSLLAHEVSHAIVARRHGVAVRGMTLWLFGGVAELEGEAPTARSELRIAAVGPAASFACALAFAAGAIVGDAVGLAGVGVAVLAWLAGANVVLALFNLIPGAPLDGGRILRAFLWRRHGDRYRATISATKAGRVAGWAIIGVGLGEFVLGADAGGLWTVFIGWFVLNAARAEAAQATATHALAGLRVSDVMSPNPRTVPGWLSVHAFVHEYALVTRFSSFPVEDLDGSVVGLVTLAQVKARPQGDWPNLTVAAVMTPLDQVAVATPDDELVAALQRTPSRAAGGRMLAFDAGRLVGIVSPTDLAWCLERNLMRGGGEHPTTVRRSLDRSDDGHRSNGADIPATASGSELLP